MKKYEVTGMSCAACAARVEKAANSVEGVSSCAVNLLTNSMGVEGTYDEKDLFAAVEKAGYGVKGTDPSATSPSAVPPSGSSGNSKAVSSADEPLADKETPVLLKRLFTSLGFLLILMYFSMGHMWNWPLPPFFDENFMALGLVQLILATIILYINRKFFINGFKGLVHASPNMDTLVALGSGVSYLWSVYSLFAMTRAGVDSDSQAVMNFYMNLYFESSAMILTLITVGKTLEAKSKGKTTDALRALMKLSPKTAVVLRDGKEVEVDVETVKVDELFIVRPGQKIPLDGVVLEGNSAVDESALTGESIPVDKVKDSQVSSGTLNQNGFLKCKATRVGQDTTINQIIQMVSDASATKAPIARIADKVSGVFVPAVMSVAFVTFVVWMLCGAQFSYALARGISVLVISCPCALGLATPVAIMVGSGKGARNGILFKTAESLEAAGQVKTVVLDKTGTITQGKPVVTDVLCSADGDENKLLQTVTALESKSEHPLAKAIVNFAAKRGLSPLFQSTQSDSGASLQPLTDFEEIGGKGLKAVLNGEKVFAGNETFIKDSGFGEDETFIKILPEIAAFEKQGKTPVFAAAGHKFLGAVLIADVIKETSPQAVKALKKMGINVVMLTGDNQQTAAEIARQAGIDTVIAGVLPGGKADVIKSLQKAGEKVAMIGDGINDALSLTVADVGIAIGAGTDVAIDAADVVLMKDSLMDAVKAIRLSKRTVLNIKENLFWAFIYNVLGIPLAAGCYVKLFGWSMNPMFGAAAMSLSSFCVVSNALRLNLVRLEGKSKGEKPAAVEESELSGKNKTDVGDALTSSQEGESDKEKGDKNMTKTLKVEGMMCSHCEAHVKEALEKVDGVTSAVTSHEKGTAVIELSKEVPEAALKDAIVAAGYEYKGIM